MFRKLAIAKVSNRCNHACVFCSEGAVHDGSLVPLDTVAQLLVRLKAKGYDAVNLMGAETTLRPDLPELLQLVRHHGLQAALTTNATRLASRELSEQLVPLLACIEISLPAADRDTYQTITSRDHLPRVEAALRNVAQVAQTMEKPPVIVINTVVCRLNRDAPAQVARLLAELDLQPQPLLHFIRARAKGRAVGGTLSLGLPECVTSFRKGVRLARAAGLPVMFRGLPICCLFDEVEHNFWALEALSQPDNTYLNRTQLTENAPIEERAQLDRKGSRAIEACAHCGLQPLCPGLHLETPDDPIIQPPDPCPTIEALSARLRRGPLAGSVLAERPAPTLPRLH